MNDPTLHPITVTHARMRARQGDRVVAERILLALLERGPSPPEVQALLEQVRRTAATPPRHDEQAPPPERAPAHPSALTGRFRRELAAVRDPRVVRLERWLARILRG